VPDRATVCGLFEALSETESVPVRAPTWVGVKTTAIWQLFPAANVAPHGVLPVAVFVAKLALVVTPEITRVTLPPLVSVTFFAALVAPTTVVASAREVGEIVTPVASGFTVTLNDVSPFKLPEVPLIITENVPVAAEPLAVRVNVLVEDAGFGLNAAVTPVGRPEADNVTLPVKPPPSVIVMVLVALPP
jgi:hypothetical protein